MEEELWVMNTRIFDLKKLRVGGWLYFIFYGWLRLISEINYDRTILIIFHKLIAMKVGVLMQAYMYYVRDIAYPSNFHPC
jgi:hypothetical protein